MLSTCYFHISGCGTDVGVSLHSCLDIVHFGLVSFLDLWFSHWIYWLVFWDIPALPGFPIHKIILLGISEIYFGVAFEFNCFCWILLLFLWSYSSAMDNGRKSFLLSLLLMWIICMVSAVRFY